MVNTKLNTDKNAIIVKKVAIAATLRNVPHGARVRFTRTELGYRDSTVRMAISRLNETAGMKEYAMDIDEQDGSYLITRL